MSQSSHRNKVYAVLYPIIWVFMKLFHPWNAVGVENIPEGSAVICGNHTTLGDPLYVVCGMGRKRQTHVMAKAEVMKWPVIGFLLKKAGIIGVNRGKSDMAAAKECLRVLKNGEKLLMFPEGTRVKDGETSEARTGAAMFATRTGTPLVPVYISPQKLLVTALRPGLRRGRKEYFQIRLRQHYRADIPAIHNDIVLTGGPPLHLHQKIPYHWKGRSLGSTGGDFILPNGFRYILAPQVHVLESILLIGHGDDQVWQYRLHPGRVRRGHAPAPDRQPYRTVDGSGIHIQKPKLLGQTLGQRGFSRS